MSGQVSSQSLLGEGQGDVNMRGYQQERADICCKGMCLSISPPFGLGLPTPFGVVPQVRSSGTTLEVRAKL